VRHIARQLKCQVGGGIRSLATARSLLEAGAHRVIIGSALLKEGKIDQTRAIELANALGTAPLVFALDSRGGRVSVSGWREQTGIAALDMVRALDAFCETFLYTHIDTEGLMRGLPLEPVHALRRATSRRLVVAGGIKEQQEIDALDAMGIDAVAGMAVYTGKIPC
jgi:phosphoribosylformimino-5-aminoimidazole carboxamide ribotide isomerase